MRKKHTSVYEEIEKKRLANVNDERIRRVFLEQLNSIRDFHRGRPPTILRCMEYATKVALEGELDSHHSRYLITNINFIFEHIGVDYGFSYMVVSPAYDNTIEEFIEKANKIKSPTARIYFILRATKTMGYNQCRTAKIKDYNPETGVLIDKKLPRWIRAEVEEYIAHCRRLGAKDESPFFYRDYTHPQQAIMNHEPVMHMQRTIKKAERQTGEDYMGPITKPTARIKFGKPSLRRYCRKQGARDG